MSKLFGNANEWQELCQANERELMIPVCVCCHSHLLPIAQVLALVLVLVLVQCSCVGFITYIQQALVGGNEARSQVYCPLESAVCVCE